jgi:hypothetical protein
MGVGAEEFRGTRLQQVTRIRIVESAVVVGRV